MFLGYFFIVVAQQYANLESFQTKMVIYCAACSVAAAVAINRQIKGAEKATPAIRKVFHIFAVAVFLPGFLYHCSFIYLASGVVFGIFISLEVNCCL